MEYTSLFLGFPTGQLVFPCSYQQYQRHTAPSLRLYLFLWETILFSYDIWHHGTQVKHGDSKYALQLLQWNTSLKYLYKATHTLTFFSFAALDRPDWPLTQGHPLPRAQGHSLSPTAINTSFTTVIHTRQTTATHTRVITASHTRVTTATHTRPLTAAHTRLNVTCILHMLLLQKLSQKVQCMSQKM